jgi:prepilin-type N-terminal cleavage/methylation domain-containing protein
MAPLSQKGYTLVETMVVLGITASLSVLGVVTFSAQIAHNHLTDAARQILSDLRLVRQKAITEGVNGPVRFDPEGRKYFLLGLGERTLPAQVRFGLGEGVPPLPDTVLPDDGISFRENIVTFQPNGTMTGVGGVVYLTNDSVHNETIAISVITTGRVKIRRWNGNVWR